MPSRVAIFLAGPARRTASLVGVALWAAAGLAGCARFVQVEETDLLKKTEVRRIALLPFANDLYVQRAGGQEGQVVTCLYDGKQFPFVHVSASAFDEVTAGFTQQLSIRGRYEFVMPGEVKSFVTGRGLDPAGLDPPAFFGAIGEGLGVDAVLAGNVFRYDERRGSAYGAEKPASVAIDVHLIDARSGRLLWGASYSESQAALTENAAGIGMVVQRGARFLTVNQLATWAVAQIVERFPEPRWKEEPGRGAGRKSLGSDAVPEPSRERAGGASP